MNSIKLSVVIPFYNEEDNLAKLHQQVVNVLRIMGDKSEIIYVDDGSKDQSLKNLKIAVKKNKFKEIESYLIKLERNLGQTAATAAGIDYARGKVLAFMDADLQNDPKDFPKLLNKLQEGHDAVVGWRKNRTDNLFRKFFSSMANLMIRRGFGVPLHDMGCSIKVVRRKALTNFKLYSEYHRLIPALIYWNGAKVTEIVVNHHPRLFGKSNYGYFRVFKVIIDLITIKFLSSYHTKPSYVFGTLGILAEFAAGLVLIAVAYRKFFQGVFVHRDPLFLIAIFLIIVGLQFILMGVLAELIVRIYFEGLNKPIYAKPTIRSL
ncbi:MAG: glycosyltransferase [Candidatus Daviesbacteria bacterium]|nr:glycosyltransferase [Candidatus Daviesbacteria bacterium]